MPAGVELDKNEWIPVVEVEHKGPEFKTIGTQTHGIFYPSARTITNQKGKEFNKKMIHISARDRLPQLHSYSPGKGRATVCVEDLWIASAGIFFFFFFFFFFQHLLLLNFLI